MKRSILRQASRWTALSVGLALITACGSGNGSGGGGGGASKTPWQPVSLPPSDGTGLPATKMPPGSAKFHVDVPSGKVTVTSLDGSSRAVLDGAAVRFDSSTLYLQPGDSGVRTLSVTLTNQTGLTLGKSQGGQTTGLLVLFEQIATGAPMLSVGSYANVATLAGTGVAGSADGPVGAATFNNPCAVCYGPAGEIYVSDGKSYKVRRIDDGQVTTLAGNGVSGAVDGSGTSGGFGSPRGLAYNSIDNSLVVCDFAGRRVRRVGLDGSITTIAGSGATGNGDGSGATATFWTPIGVTLANGGNTFYIADWDGNCVRRIDYTGTNRALASSYTVTTLAGNGTAGGQDGVGTAATFSGPSGICSANGTLYVVEGLGRRVRQVTTAGAVSTVAGTGAQAYQDGSGEAAAFGQPFGIAPVPQGLVVCDGGYQRLRLLTLKNGASGTGATSWWVRTLAGTGAVGGADGTGAQATFNQPIAAGADPAGTGRVVVVEYSGNRVRQVAVSGTIGEPGSPNGVNAAPVTLSNADGLYPYSGTALPYKRVISTLAAGATSAAQEWWFATPSGVTAFDFVVAVQSLTTGTLPVQVGSGTLGSSGNWVRTLAGQPSQTGYTDGQPAQAQFNYVHGLAVDGTGAVYAADYLNDCIRRIATDGTVTTVVGQPGVSGDGVGTGQQALLSNPAAVAISADGRLLAISDYSNDRIKLAVLTNGAPPQLGSSWTVTTICGGGADSTTKTEIGGGVVSLNGPDGIAFDSAGSLYFCDSLRCYIRKLRPINGGTASWMVSVLAGSGTQATTNGTLTAGAFVNPSALAINRLGELYVSETTGAVRVIKPAANQVSTLYTFSAGRSTYGLAVDDANQVYASVYGGATVVRFDAAGPLVVAGQDGGIASADGPGDTARLANVPRGMTVDHAGNLYFAEPSRVRTIERIVHGN